jgi:malate dehydrogenase (oxaloacetate-decarboxylating)
VLGLGDIGPAAAMPVMEGKSLLFKRFADVDAVPICLACTGTDEIVAVVAALAPSFGGINLEDISAPRCFEIEDRLRRLLDIPVFHDDQHGTAIVTLAALRGAARVAGKEFGRLRAVVAGAGASGVAVTKMLLRTGIGDIAVSDSKGLIYRGREGLNPVKADLAERTNRVGLTGSTESALRGADVFIGLSSGTVAESAIASMAPGAIVFALSNPDPEVHPGVAGRHALVVATGRSRPGPHRPHIPPLTPRRCRLRARALPPPVPRPPTCTAPRPPNSMRPTRRFSHPSPTLARA